VSEICASESHPAPPGPEIGVAADEHDCWRIEALRGVRTAIVDGVSTCAMPHGHSSVTTKQDAAAVDPMRAGSK
jgi:hypothetical protein